MFETQGTTQVKLQPFRRRGQLVSGPPTTGPVPRDLELAGRLTCSGVSLQCWVCSASVAVICIRWHICGVRVFIPDLDQICTGFGPDFEDMDQIEPGV